MTKQAPSDISLYSDDQIREIAELPISSSGSLLDEESSKRMPEKGATESGVRFITRFWDDRWWSPLRITQGRIKLWQNGDWEYYAVVDVESRHSDWDVWVDLKVKSTFNDEIIHTFATDVAYTDEDHDDDPQGMEASGNSHFLFIHFDRFESGDYVFVRQNGRRRDN